MMVYKVAYLLCSILLVAVNSEPPSNQYGTPLAPPISSYGTPNYNVNGHNGDHHNDDHSEPKAYEFGYQVKDDYTGNNYNRQEASDGNQVRGEYRVQLPDGRTQIVTYYADWQTGFHADVRYEGTASYPDQYNNGGANNYHGAPSNQYGAPSNQYGAPGFGSGGGQGGYSGGYDNSQYNSGAYNAQSPTSSVSIKDYSNGGSGYNTGNNYNNGYNAGQNYDNYNSGGFGGKIVPTPVYGAP